MANIEIKERQILEAMKVAIRALDEYGTARFGEIKDRETGASVSDVIAAVALSAAYACIVNKYPMSLKGKILEAARTAARSVIDADHKLKQLELN